MYSMKEACKLTNLTYEKLKFYCNEGLILNVKRDSNNYRIFDESDIEWINGITCLKNCGMSLKEIKEYIKLCFDGEKTINKRKEILKLKKIELEKKIEEINNSIMYIDKKNKYYDDVLNGNIKYKSNIKTN
ncbi:MAG: MerR family transcriptional regulator [Erysipelotrichaceae bacterium]|nr:MerR family transcriptional regulator [Erysipelotrichaceae bacterium]